MDFSYEGVTYIALIPVQNCFVFDPRPMAYGTPNYNPLDDPS